MSSPREMLYEGIDQALTELPSTYKHRETLEKCHSLLKIPDYSSEIYRSTLLPQVLCNLIADYAEFTSQEEKLILTVHSVTMPLFVLGLLVKDLMNSSKKSSS